MSSALPGTVESAGFPPEAARLPTPVTAALVLLLVRVVVAVSCRLCPVGGGVLPVMLGCRAVLRGMLTVALGGSSVAAGLEAVFLLVGQAGLGSVERLDEVRPVCGRCVAVLSAHRPVGGGIGPVASVLRTGSAAALRLGITFLGPAVTVLGPHVAPVRPFHQRGDPWFIPSARAARGPAITGIGLAVPMVGNSVAFIGVAVPLSGHPVAMVRSPVTLIGGLVDRVSPGRGSFTRDPGLVAGRCGPLSHASRLVAKLRLPIALVGGRGRSRGTPSLRNAVALVGDVVALVGDSGALVGDALALTSSIQLIRWRASASPLPVTFTGQFAPPLPRLAVSSEPDHGPHLYPPSLTVGLACGGA